MATDVDHGAECSASRIRLLGVVAEIEARMESLRLGDSVPDHFLFRDDFSFPPGMMQRGRYWGGLCGPEPPSDIL